MSFPTEPSLTSHYCGDAAVPRAGSVGGDAIGVPAVRAKDRERAARRGRVVRPRLRRHASAGSSSIEYGLLIALVGALLCLGIGYSVKSMFEGAIQCFIANLQGVTGEGCSSETGTTGGGGTGTVGPAISPGPSAPPTPTPTPTATPTASATP